MLIFTWCLFLYGCLLSGAYAVAVIELGAYIHRVLTFNGCSLSYMHVHSYSYLPFKYGVCPAASVTFVQTLVNLGRASLLFVRALLFARSVV